MHSVKCSATNEQKITVPTAYSGPLPITQEKKNDLMTLLCFIPDVYHDFYKSLKTSNDVCDPLISENESD